MREREKDGKKESEKERERERNERTNEAKVNFEKRFKTIFLLSTKAKKVC